MDLKETIIVESLKLFSLNGFLSTSIKDILGASGASKGGRGEGVLNTNLICTVKCEFLRSFYGNTRSDCCLGAVSDKKALLIVVVTKDLTNRFHAGNIVKQLAAEVGGNGGSGIESQY